MMHIWFHSVFRAGGFAALLTLAACAGVDTTADASTCQGRDWLSLGRADGEAGQPEARREALFAECAAAGAPADLAAYRAGRAEGLADYCTEEVGYFVGRSGAPYFQVCDDRAHGAAFLDAFKRGRTDLARLGREEPDPRPLVRHYRPYYGWGWGYRPGPFFYGGPAWHFRYGYGAYVP